MSERRVIENRKQGHGMSLCLDPYSFLRPTIAKWGSELLHQLTKQVSSKTDAVDDTAPSLWTVAICTVLNVVFLQTRSCGGRSPAGGTYRNLYYHDLFCECAFDFFKFATGEHRFDLARCVSSKVYLPRIGLYAYIHTAPRLTRSAIIAVFARHLGWTMRSNTTVQ